MNVLIVCTVATTFAILAALSLNIILEFARCRKSPKNL